MPIACSVRISLASSVSRREIFSPRSLRCEITVMPAEYLKKPHSSTHLFRTLGNVIKLTAALSPYNPNWPKNCISVLMHLTNDEMKSVAECTLWHFLKRANFSSKKPQMFYQFRLFGIAIEKNVNSQKNLL